MQMRMAGRDVNCKQRGVKFDTKIEGLLNYENFENSCRGEKTEKTAMAKYNCAEKFSTGFESETLAVNHS